MIEIKPGRPKGLRGPDKNPHLDPMASGLRFPLAANALPADVSYEYLFGPIGDQGQASTCVGWGTSATLAAYQHKRLKLTAVVPLSPAAVYAMTKLFYENSDPSPGLYISDALNMLSAKGWVLNSDWPYPASANDQNVLTVPPSKFYQLTTDVKAFARVALDVASMRIALFTHGPIVIGTSWGSNWENVGPDGVMDQNPGADMGGHCVVLAGYSDPKKAFRLRNSWGTGWGDDGYGWLPYAANANIWDAWVVTV